MMMMMMIDFHKKKFAQAKDNKISINR